MRKKELFVDCATKGGHFACSHRFTPRGADLLGIVELDGRDVLEVCNRFLLAQRTPGFKLDSMVEVARLYHTCSFFLRKSSATVSPLIQSCKIV